MKLFDACWCHTYDHFRMWNPFSSLIFWLDDTKVEHHISLHVRKLHGQAPTLTLGYIGPFVGFAVISSKNSSMIYEHSHLYFFSFSEILQDPPFYNFNKINDCSFERSERTHNCRTGNYTSKVGLAWLKQWNSRKNKMFLEVGTIAAINFAWCLTDPKNIYSQPFVFFILL